MLRHARVFAMPCRGIILVVSGSLGQEAPIGPVTAMVTLSRKTAIRLTGAEGPFLSVLRKVRHSQLS